VARVFLSYRHEEDLDTKIAEAIYASLNNLNHEVFLDLKRIRPGDRWAETIEKNLEIAEYFVPLISVQYLYRTTRRCGCGAWRHARRSVSRYAVTAAL
jgi:TIR domain